MTDLAQRDDVISCYETFLGRKPESDAVIENHLRGRLRIVDIAKIFAESVEYRSRFLSFEHFSFQKCFSEKYLITGLGLDKKIACFLHNYSVLNAECKPDLVKSLSRGGLELFSDARRHEYSVRFGTPLSIINEGELSFDLQTQGRVIQTLSFTIVPGWVFGNADPSAILVSRMQGQPASKELWKLTAKEFFGVTPQMILFECAVGVAKAMKIGRVLGVCAERQPSYTPQFDHVFKNCYNRFFLDRGVEETNGVYVYCLGQRPNVNAGLSTAHRLIAAKRRSLRAEIAAKAEASWRRLSVRES